MDQSIERFTKLRKRKFSRIKQLDLIGLLLTKEENKKFAGIKIVFQR